MDNLPADRQSTARDRSVIAHFQNIRDALVLENEPLREYTRFDLGGPADILFDTASETAFTEALRLVNKIGVAHLILGGGTNLVVADEGFRGVALRYTGAGIRRDGVHLTASAGASLQDVVDTSIQHGLTGIATMTGIPGYLGGAIYGNAGAYGNSMDEVVDRVRVFADNEVKQFSNAECQFAYRESIFKRQKEWFVLSATLRLSEGIQDELEKASCAIRKVRDAKYPPSMKCAGSIFKNVLLKNLPQETLDRVPPSVTKGGKAPSAWFLEQAGVKGLRRGDIQVAEYHANLIYNDGAGTTRDLIAVIAECKKRVHDLFGLELEEEVQYVGNPSQR